MTDNNQQQQPENTNGVIQLYAYVKQPEHAPLYIIENNSLIMPLIQANVEQIYFLDNIHKELKNETTFFKTPMQPTTTPIILLADPNNKRGQYVFDTLKAANVNVFRQNPKEEFDPITCKGVEQTRAELIKQYRTNYSVGGNIKEFDDIVNSSANTPAVKTGFKQLDEILDGGLYEGLYAIGAISSLGKTAYCLQIADNIAAQGQDVIIISMEMSKFEFIGRSISRLTFLFTQQENGAYKYEHAKTERGITDGSRYKNYSAQELELIETCKKIYAERAGQHMFIYESIGGLTVENIEKLIDRHIDATGNKPIVIIDYLQCLQHSDKYINANDKMKTDANLWALKALSRNRKLTILAISSFNRDSYTKKPTFSSFKESGAIEYTCSVIMSMYYKGIGGEIEEAQAKAKDPREIYVEILKNRQGRVGDKIGLFYFPKFNYFQEDPEQHRQTAADNPQRVKKKNGGSIDLEKLFMDTQKDGRAKLDDMTEHLGGGGMLRKALERQYQKDPKFDIVGGIVSRHIEPENLAFEI